MLPRLLTRYPSRRKEETERQSQHRVYARLRDGDEMQYSRQQPGKVKRATFFIVAESKGPSLGHMSEPRLSHDRQSSARLTPQCDPISPATGLPANA